jgi:hypothetical protein
MSDDKWRDRLAMLIVGSLDGEVDDGAEDAGFDGPLFLGATLMEHGTAVLATMAEDDEAGPGGTRKFLISISAC